MLGPLDAAVGGLAAGGVTVVRDSDEAYAAVAADAVTAEQVAFLAGEARGALQLVLGHERWRELHLPVTSVGIGVPAGAPVGGSAAGRADTARAAADPATAPGDLVHDGVLLAIAGHPDGVLGRLDARDAALDLVRLAGRAPAVLVCQLLGADGARLAEPDAFSQRFGLPTCGIPDVVDARLRREGRLSRQVRVPIPTEFGTFDFVGYRSAVDGRHHLAAVMGDVAGRGDVLLHMHASCVLADALGAMHSTAGAELRASMRRISQAGSGAIVYLTRDGERLEHLAGCGCGRDRCDVCHDGVAVGAEIVRDLGPASVVLLGGWPQTAARLARYGVAVSERVPLAAIQSVRGTTRPENWTTSNDRP